MDNLKLALVTVGWYALLLALTLGTLALAFSGWFAWLRTV